MKNLILQHFSVEPDLAEVKQSLYTKAVGSVKRYADNIGWDYQLKSDNYFKGFSPVWEVFRILESEEFEEYDRIVFVDADVFIRDTDVNVFEKYNEFSACKEVDDPHPKSRPEYVKWGNQYFNSGIIVFTRHSINKLRELNPRKYRETYKNTKPGRDQYALNLMVEQAFGKYRKINRSDCCFLRETKYSKHAPVIHVAGRCRQIYNNDVQSYDKEFGV